MKNKVDWQKVINDYDPKRETIKEYCARLQISRYSYYAKRKELRSERKLMPVTVESPSITAVEINHVPLRYKDSISDNELKRLIRLCSEL